MHEMSIASNLIALIREELTSRGLTKLVRAHVIHGRLTHVEPEALAFAWKTCTLGTDLEGAELHLEEIPVQLRCGECGEEFSPEEIPGVFGANVPVFAPCPKCGEELGHEVLSGQELYLNSLEAE